MKTTREERTHQFRWIDRNTSEEKWIVNGREEWRRSSLSEQPVKSQKLNTISRETYSSASLYTYILPSSMKPYSPYDYPIDWNSEETVWVEWGKQNKLTRKNEHDNTTAI